MIDQDSVRHEMGQGSYVECSTWGSGTVTMRVFVHGGGGVQFTVEPEQLAALSAFLGSYSRQCEALRALEAQRRQERRG